LLPWSFLRSKNDRLYRVSIQYHGCRHRGFHDSFYFYCQEKIQEIIYVSRRRQS
jgi:hypothetical protein